MKEVDAEQLLFNGNEEKHQNLTHFKIFHQFLSLASKFLSFFFFRDKPT